MANNTVQIYGDYSPTIDPMYSVSPLVAISALAEKYNYGPGCTDNKCIDYNEEQIKTAVKDTQLIVVCLGTGELFVFAYSKGNPFHIV